MFKRKDWLVIVIALLLALGLFILTRSGMQNGLPGANDAMRVLTEVNPPANANDAKGDAQAYLVLTVGNTRYKPLALYRDAVYRLHQSNGHDNVIHVTRDSVYMESANCDNQDCIKQGMVNFTNRETRVLGNMIICLPNQVVLELMTPQEAGVNAQ